MFFFSNIKKLNFFFVVLKRILFTKTKFQDDFDSPPDQLYGNRVHSWVMIMQSDTNDESIQTANSPLYFIEPSTSELIDISNENYIGIEAVWNNKNYWVNLQPLSGGCAVCLS